MLVWNKYKHRKEAGSNRELLRCNYYWHFYEILFWKEKWGCKFSGHRGQKHTRGKTLSTSKAIRDYETSYFECAASSSFQYVPTREGRRKTEMWSQRKEHSTKFIRIFALCSVTWTAGLTHSALFLFQLLASPDVWSCVMKTFELFVSDCLQKVVVYKSVPKAVWKVSLEQRLLLVPKSSLLRHWKYPAPWVSETVFSKWLRQQLKMCF